MTIYYYYYYYYYYYIIVDFMMVGFQLPMNLSNSRWPAFNSR